ncbi:hypothetical protein LGR54_18840 [Ancylobacter sp. Lp-2]|uniref:hypothetical protein n=1 Tax=Ancylobacter sp. Lp-2 TaxID=2881339 RepID=UPI001E31954C|nr:hypothetical protein [Ancylobacter sp. Lp-2]MCB4770670.1 hypothetical protein [Ancylobacter sp. Lp-2]
MKLWRVPDPEIFDAAPEWRMGLHLARGGRDRTAYLVLGGVVAVAVEEIGTPVEPVEGVSYLRSSWLHPACRRREELFAEWLDYLWPVAGLSVERHDERLSVTECREVAELAMPAADWTASTMVPTVEAMGVLPVSPARSSAPSRPLPFATVSEASTVVHRWEAFPVSRRSAAGSSSIAPATFAAPEREKAFIPSGFAALGRRGLPSVLPACFLYTLEPQPASVIECGATLSAYGPAGGAVELRFPHATPTRAPIASPATLPVF